MRKQRMEGEEQQEERERQAASSTEMCWEW